MLKKKIAVAAAVLFVFFIATLSVYASYMSHTVSSREGDTIVIRRDFPLTSDLEEMVRESDVVVVGEYTGFASSWNMARNPYNVQEEDTEHYVEGHLFHFTVSELLKGDVENAEIQVNHRFAEKLRIEDSDAIISDDGRILKEATYVDVKEVMNPDPLYIEPETGKTYILFLKQDPVFKNYYGAIEPFSIQFDHNNVAELQTNIKTIKENDFKQDVRFNGKNFTIQNEMVESVNDTISGANMSEIIQKIKNAEI